MTIKIQGGQIYIFNDFDYIQREIQIILNPTNETILYFQQLRLYRERNTKNLEGGVIHDQHKKPMIDTKII